MLLYRTSETELSRRVEGNAPDITQMESTIHNYYDFDVEGVPITITRVGGSSGRVLVDYYTMDVDTNLITNGDLPATELVDYYPVAGTLVFDDFEMSKTIYVEIGDDGGVPQPNRDFVLVLTNAVLDANEDSVAVSPPRVDANFGTAAFAPIIRVATFLRGKVILPRRSLSNTTVSSDTDTSLPA